MSTKNLDRFKFEFHRSVTVVDMKINTSVGGLPVAEIVWGVSVDSGEVSRFVHVNTKGPFGMSPDAARETAALILKAVKAVEDYKLPDDISDSREKGE